MSYTYLLYHIVIRTKRSERTIAPAFERDLYAYIYSFIKARDCVLYRVNGMPDHVHILVNIHPTIALASFVRDLKTATSKMMKANRSKYPMFDGWEREYYACTISQSGMEAERQYVINQKEHHKKVSTRDEIIKLCKDNNIPYKEEYL